MKGHEYSDLVATYIDQTYSVEGLVVYTEVPLGKTVIGKNRRIDIFVRNESSTKALGIECKYQSTSGTTEEKIPYALNDLDAMWIPGCLVYGGLGWSAGILHTLAGARNAVRFEPPIDPVKTTKWTTELDHVIGSVFSLWNKVIPLSRLFRPDRQMTLPEPAFVRAENRITKSSLSKAKQAK